MLFDPGRPLTKAMNKARHRLQTLLPTGMFSSPRAEATLNNANLSKADLESLIARLPTEAFKGRKINPARQADCSALMEKFQSVGNNCEFGFVQRFFGAEPLDLFRFCAMSPSGLVAAIESRLSVIQNSENLDLEFEGEFENGQPQMAISVRQYDVRFHAGNMPSRTSFSDIRATQGKKLNLLARKFLEDLADGERIFVCKCDAAAESDVRRLAALMRSFGPTSLLWVTPEEPSKPVGMVEQLSNGLMRGYINCFAHPRTLNNAMVTQLRRGSFSSRYEKLGGFSALAWLKLCCEAYRLHIHQPALALP